MVFEIEMLIFIKGTFIAGIYFKPGIMAKYAYLATKFITKLIIYGSLITPFVNTCIIILFDKYKLTAIQD